MKRTKRQQAIRKVKEVLFGNNELEAVTDILANEETRELNELTQEEIDKQVLFQQKNMMTKDVDWDEVKYSSKLCMCLYVKSKSPLNKWDLFASRCHLCGGLRLPKKEKMCMNPLCINAVKDGATKRPITLIGERCWNCKLSTYLVTYNKDV